MSKREFLQNLLLFSLVILIGIGFAASASAAPAVTVVSPNGGEVVSGVYPITWTVSDASNTQTLIADLFYSSIPWNGGIPPILHQIDANIDLLGTCDFPTGVTWETSDLPTTGLPTTAFLDASNYSYENFSFLNYNGTWLFDAAVLAPTVRLTYYFDAAIATWLPDNANDYNAGLPNCPIGGGVRSETLFKIGTNLYALIYNCGGDGVLQGYRYNGTNWIPNYDINRITPFNVDYQVGYHGINVFIYAGIPRMLVGSIANPISFTQGLEFDWNGSGWQASADLNGDFRKTTSLNNIITDNGFATNVVLFNRLGNLFFIETPFQSNTYNPQWSGVFNGTNWIPNYDINRGMDLLEWAWTNNIRIYSSIDENNGDYFYLMRARFFPSAGGGVHISIKKLHKTEEKYITSDAKTCTYNWDTTIASNGLWYADVEVSNGMDSTVDASAAAFSILNFSTDDLTVSCLSNCTSSFDANAIVITPITEGNDIIFKVKNNMVFKSILYKTLNSLQDDRRYRVDVIDCGTVNGCSNYQQGNWVFDSTLTYGTATGNVSTTPIQKIWDVNNSYYNYSFADTLTGNQYKYYKLVYRSPIRGWNNLADNAYWFQQLAPANSLINGQTWATFPISSYSNINNYVIEPIPIIAPPTAYYEFQFTGYADGAETLQIGDGNYWWNVNLTASPHTYSVQINDINHLTLKTTASSANTIYLTDVVLLDRGYFKTRLTLLKENGELLDIWVNPAGEDKYDSVSDAAAFSSIAVKDDQNVGQTFRTTNADALKQFCVKGWRSYEDVSCGEGFDIAEGQAVDLNIYKIAGTTATTRVATASVQKADFPEGCGSGDAEWVCWDLGEADVDIYTDYYAEITTTDTNGYRVVTTNTTDYPYGGFYINRSPYPLDALFKTFVSTTGVSYNYIDEGSGFKFSTLAYDREQKLTQYKVETFAYTAADENKIFTYIKDLNSPAQEYFFSLNDLVPPIYLLHVAGGSFTEQRSPIKLQVSLCDASQCYEQQSEWLTLHNYPFFSNDAMIQVQEEARVPNTPPKGDIVLRGRVPANFAAVRMQIFTGSWICNPDMNSAGDTACNASNTAPVSALAYTKMFYNGIDFACQGAKCDFKYDLSNYFHYPNEGYYTTFAEVLFKTTDANNWVARTIYPIGKQPLAMTLEAQGYDPQYYIDSNCVGNIAGVTRTEIIMESVYNGILKFLSNPVLAFQSFIGRWGRNDYENMRNNLITQGELPHDSPFLAYFGDANCGVRLPPTTNLKITAAIYTVRLDDLHNYLVASLRLKHQAGDYVTPYFYPTEQFYSPDTGANNILFNNNFYDTNGNLLADDNYMAEVTVTDQSLQNSPITKELIVVIDHTAAVVQPQIVQIIPMSLWAVDTSTGTLSIRSFIQTRRKYIDKVEFSLYTNYSSFDPFKSDESNQIIKFSLDAEDLVKLEEDPQNFDLNLITEQFKTDFITADVFGACAQGATIGTGVGIGAGLLLVGAGLVASGVGAPVGAGVLATAIAVGGGFGGLSGCGTGSIAAWGSGAIHNMQINDQMIQAINDANYNRTRQVTIQFSNLQITDFEDEVAASGLDKNTVGEENLIDALHAAGKKSTRGDITIYVNGKKYSKENVLVGRGDLISNLKKHSLKMRMVVYYDYFQQSTIGTYDLVTLNKPTADLTDIEGTMRWVQGGALYIFNTYAPLVVVAFLGLTAVMFFYSTSKRRKEK